MRTYFHVAPAHYEIGDDLLSFDELEASGRSATWKYDGEPVDTDVVCLFETVAEARDFVDTFLPDGQILCIAIPDDADDIRFTRVEEGYPAVFRSIPAQYITMFVR